jgi:hypothetical protein
MQVIVSNEVQEIQKLVKEGFCPVECSIGAESIVDELVMDHHGTYSHLESVAVRAYRDHFGVRKNDQRFVVAGVMDADASFAIAALTGLLPEGLSDLADTIGLLDVDPIGHDIPSLNGGPMVLVWQAFYGGGRDSFKAITAIDGWLRLTENPRRFKEFFDATVESENQRKETAGYEQKTLGVSYGKILTINGSTVFGFPVWYGRKAEYPADDIDGWQYPVVISLVAKTKNITLACPNQQVAKKLFGEGGLKNIFAKLEGNWGGREAVGGSPRGKKMTENDLRIVVEIVQANIIE